MADGFVASGKCVSAGATSHDRRGHGGRWLPAAPCRSTAPAPDVVQNRGKRTPGARRKWHGDRPLRGQSCVPTPLAIELNLPWEWRRMGAPCPAWLNPVNGSRPGKVERRRDERTEGQEWP